ncbi:MAG: hypothetical protein ACR2M0_06360 [Chloroflexia bacterium]
MSGGTQQTGGTGRRGLPLLGALDDLSRVLLIGVVLLMFACICGTWLVLYGSGLLRGGAPPATVISRASTEVAGTPTTVAEAPAIDTPAANSPQVGQLVTSTGVDTSANNSPINPTNSFPRNIPAIYTVLQANQVPAGTTAFARWTREDQLFQDTQEIRAAQVFTKTYIEFSLQPTPGKLTPGNYAVQIFLNGAPGPRTQFTVR